MNLQNDPILRQVPEIKETVLYEIRDGIVYIINLNDTKLHNFLRRFKKNIPTRTEIEFDKLSSRTFELIDGQRTIYEIGQIIGEEFKEEADPLYERLVVYFDGLANNVRYITLKDGQ